MNHDPNLTPSEEEGTQASQTHFLRLFMGIGLMVFGCSVITLLGNPPDSPQYVLSICNMGIGLVLIIGVIVFMRLIRGSANHRNGK